MAQKQYDQVDPNNRLVASTLERRWNEALLELEKVRQQISDMRQKQNVVTADQREQVLALAGDLPRLWHAPETSAKDKKRILQLLLKDITVEKPQRYQAVFHIRWQGGAREDLAVKLPRSAADRWRHDKSLVAKVRELAKQYSDEEIAAMLNAEGLISAKGNHFTRSSISWIRHKHKIPPAENKKPDMEDLWTWTPETGVPQGAVLSPVLSNAYLNPLDHRMAERGFQMVRYADDFVILCRTREEAEAALAVVREWVETHGLKLHPEKTHIVDAREESFSFLGYSFRGEFRFPRAKSHRKFVDRIRELTPRKSGESLEFMLQRMNRATRGWFNYFRHCHWSIFRAYDGMIRRRLRRLLLKRHPPESQTPLSK